jgi:EmrB/QacA subfamily drug resistance transporter
MDKNPKRTGADEVWQPAIPPRQTALVFGGMLLVLLLAALDQTIVSTALPKIVADLQGLEYYSWVATIYMLCSAVTVPIYGKLSDLFGRKYIMLFGITVFLPGSAWCGHAGSMNELIIARGLQGIGAGALIPVAFATMGNLYSPRDIGKYQGLIAGAFVLASVIGPPVGGWITDHANWRWVFYVNLPVGLAAAAVLIALMPKFASNKKRIRIDWLGAGLLMLGLATLLLSINGAPLMKSLTGLPPLWTGLAGAVVLLLFAAYEFRVEEPIIDPRLFSNSIITVSSLVTMLTGATMISGAYFLPLFLQVVMEMSPTQSGNFMLPLSVACGIGSILSGYMASRTGRYKKNALIGALLANAGLFLMLMQVGVTATTAGIIISSAVLGLGLGVGVSLYAVIVRNTVAISQMGQASAALTLFRQFGGTMGMAVAGALMGAQVSAHSVIHIDAATKTQFASGIHHIYLYLAALSVISTLLVLQLKELRLRKAGESNSDAAGDKQGTPEDRDQDSPSDR